MYLANSHNKVTQRKVLCIVGISLIHITAGSFDQFVANVIRGEGYAHQVVRDVSFMIPDIFQLFFPIWLLQRSRKQSFNTLVFFKDKSLQKDIAAMMFLVFISVTFCYLL